MMSFTLYSPCPCYLVVKDFCLTQNTTPKGAQPSRQQEGKEVKELIEELMQRLENLEQVVSATHRQLEEMRQLHVGRDDQRRPERVLLQREHAFAKENGTQPPIPQAEKEQEELVPQLIQRIEHLRDALSEKKTGKLRKRDNRN